MLGTRVVADELYFGYPFQYGLPYFKSNNNNEIDCSSIDAAVRCYYYGDSIDTIYGPSINSFAGGVLFLDFSLSSETAIDIKIPFYVSSQTISLSVDNIYTVMESKYRVKSAHLITKSDHQTLKKKLKNELISTGITTDASSTDISLGQFEDEEYLYSFEQNILLSMVLDRANDYIGTPEAPEDVTAGAAMTSCASWYTEDMNVPSDQCVTFSPGSLKCFSCKLTKESSSHSYFQDKTWKISAIDLPAPIGVSDATAYTYLSGNNGKFLYGYDSTLAMQKGTVTAVTFNNNPIMKSRSALLIKMGWTANIPLSSGNSVVFTTTSTQAFPVSKGSGTSISCMFTWQATVSSRASSTSCSWAADTTQQTITVSNVGGGEIPVNSTPEITLYAVTTGDNIVAVGEWSAQICSVDCKSGDIVADWSPTGAKGSIDATFVGKTEIQITDVSATPAFLGQIGVFEATFRVNRIL